MRNNDISNKTLLVLQNARIQSQWMQNEQGHRINKPNLNNPKEDLIIAVIITLTLQGKLDLGSWLWGFLLIQPQDH